MAGTVALEREFDRIRIRWLGSPDRPAGDERPVVITGGVGEAQATVGGCRRVVRWAEAPEGPADPAGESFDPTAVRFPLELRGWRPGDRIRLAGGTKKLKKLFVERQLGRSARERAAVLAETNGRVLWVVGVARAPVARPVPGRPALHVTVSDVGR